MKGIEELQQMIAEDRLEEVFNHLSTQEKVSNSRKLSKSLTNLSGRYHNLRNRLNSSVVSNENYLLELSQIRMATIDLVNDVEDEGESPVLKNNFKQWILAGLILVVLIPAGIIIGNEIINGDEKGEVKKETAEKNPGAQLSDVEEKKGPETISTKETKGDKSTDTAENQHTGNNSANNSKPNNRSITETKQNSSDTGGQSSQDEARTDTAKSIPLELGLKTNKGLKDVSITPEEILRVYVQVNQSCYIRVIYKLADGQLVLLNDDLQIPENKTGKFIQIGDGFIPDEPFGQETMYIFAQNSKFTPLTTKVENGYEIITEGLSASIKKTTSKGLRKNVKLAKGQLEILTAE
ncbi:MAG: DUF4384 domain-containing protein [Bacteroidia bacterium]|nr:DUF4384 domain-containing protein [Bacteroidia bacterium]